MLRSDEEKAQICLAALKSKGLDEIKNGYKVTFDGNFENTYDASSILSKEENFWHYFVFERGSTFDHAFFTSRDAALNFFFWHLTRPEPNYSIIYRDYGPGFGELSDDEEIRAFVFACNHVGISAGRFHIDRGDNPPPKRQHTWICSKSEKGWRVSQDRSGVIEFMGDFTQLNHALEFIFWSLAGVTTYEQQNASVS